VAGDFKTLNLVAKKGRCPKGQQKVVWNVSGVSGKKGKNGTNGSNGANGSAGAQGAQGVQGTAGTSGTGSGPTGATGPQGPTGNIGIAGSMGPTGVTGPPGATGATGAAGLRGATGATGTDGNNGNDGNDGATGATGATGIAGTNAAASLLSATGNTTFTASPSSPMITWAPVSGVGSAQDPDYANVMLQSPGTTSLGGIRFSFMASSSASLFFGGTIRAGLYSSFNPFPTIKPFETPVGCTITLPLTVNVGDVFYCDDPTAAPVFSTDGVVIGFNFQAGPFPSVLNGRATTSLTVN
jgi:hypothetical protein